MTKTKYLGICGTGPISRAIRWQTRGEISHTAILNVRSGQVVEALAHVPGDPWYQPGRVVCRNLSEYDPKTRCYVYESKNPEFNHCQAWDFAMNQVGMGYDYMGVVRFVSRKSHALEDVVEWFCSEVGTMFGRVGGDLVQHLPAWDVSPKLHAASPDHTTPVLCTIGDLHA